jgi:Fic family protein
VAGRGRPSREAVYRRFETAIDELRRFGGLPRPSEAQQIWSDIWHLEAHNSTAIEGNTLVLREVEALLDQGRAVGAKILKDYMEVLGYGEAARWVYGQALDPGAWTAGEPITLTELRNVHQEAMAKVWEVAPHPEATSQESPGSFRRHDIHPFGGGMKPPAWPDVPAFVSDWVEKVAEVGHGVTSGEIGLRTLPLVLAEVHSSFERIHPFIDGNGRTGRLALNLVLVRLGFPPAIIYKRQRDTYLEALDRADHDDPGALAELIARSVIDNLHRFVVPNIAGPARLVPLASLATADLSYEALRQAARRGRLIAEQGSDGMWRSSRKAVNFYIANRFKRDLGPR